MTSQEDKMRVVLFLALLGFSRAPSMAIPVNLLVDAMDALEKEKKQKGKEET